MKRAIHLSAVVLLVALLAACPNQAQQSQVAQAAQDASTVVKGFQTGEIAAHQQGLIPDADHAFIQRSLMTVAQVGKTLDTCIRGSGSNAGIIVCVNAAVATIDKLQSDGALALKSDRAKTDFALAMLGTRTALAVINTILGGTV